MNPRDFAGCFGGAGSFRKTPSCSFNAPSYWMRQGALRVTPGEFFCSVQATSSRIFEILMRSVCFCFVCSILRVMWSCHPQHSRDPMAAHAPCLCRAMANVASAAAMVISMALVVLCSLSSAMANGLDNVNLHRQNHGPGRGVCHFPIPHCGTDAMTRRHYLGRPLSFFRSLFVRFCGLRVVFELF